MEKIAFDKVNIMKCDPESSSVTIKFFSKSIVQYYALTMEFLEKSVIWSVYIKSSTEVFKKISLFQMLQFLCSDQGIW